MNKLKHFIKHSTLLWKNIWVLPKVLSGYFKTLILRKTVLRTVEFTITPDCNVECEMCYATKIKDSKRKLLTPDDYSRIWKEAKKLGAFSAIISGGEPTIRKDILEVLDAIEAKRTLVALVSNSTLLTADYIDKLQERGVNTLHLSLNSTDQVINDKIRDHDGHFHRVLDLCKIAKEKDFEVCISTVISHNKLDEMVSMVEFATKNDLNIVFSLACPTGNWEGEKEELLTPDEWKTVDAYMKSNPQVRSDWTINLSLKTECPAGREKLCISPYGDVMGCGMNFVSHGNVMDEPLKDIWERTCEFPPFKKRSEKCLIALDEDFLEDYMFPLVDFDVLPVPKEKFPATARQQDKEKMNE